MSFETTIAQSTATNIPSILLPWLSIVVILVCIWCMIVVIRRFKKDGVTKFNFPLIIICLSTVIVLGFGPETAREIFAAQDFIIAVLQLDDPDADEQDLEIALDSASDDDKKLLAFDVFSRTRPDQALTYLQTNSSRLPQNIRDRESRVLGLQAVRRVSRTGPKAILDNPKTLEGLIHLGEKDPQVARLLRLGRFDTSKLAQDQLSEILRKQGARIEGEGIHVRRK